MATSTLSINPQEDFTLDLAFKNADGTAYDLTGCAVRLQVRRSANSDDAIDKTVTGHVDAPGGLTAIVLSSADTDLAIRVWQFVLTLTDAQGIEQQSDTNYLRVTTSAPTEAPLTVQMGDNSATVTLTLAGPPGAPGQQGDPGVGVPIGGISGQVLGKTGNDDFETGWVDQTGGGGGAVDSVNGETGAVVLGKDDLGLGAVDDTADIAKPVSTATQAALDAKANTSDLATVATTGSYTDLSNKPAIPTVPVTSVAGRTGDITLTSTDVGLGNVNNTNDANKPVSTATSTALGLKADKTYVDTQDTAEATARASADSSLTTALAGKEPAVTAGTTSQYYRGDKSWQTLNQDVVPDGSTNKAYTAAEKTKLAAITGTNTGDQDLSDYAKTSGLAAAQFVESDGDDSNDGLSWGLDHAKLTIQAAIAALPANGGTVELGYGTTAVASKGRFDTATFANGSNVVSDASAVSTDVGSFVTSRFLAEVARVNSVIPGVSLTLDTNATGAGAGKTMIFAPAITLPAGVRLRGRGTEWTENSAAQGAALTSTTEIHDTGTGITVLCRHPNTGQTSVRYQIEDLSISGNSTSIASVAALNIWYLEMKSVGLHSNGIAGLIMSHNENSSSFRDCRFSGNGSAAATQITAGVLLNSPNQQASAAIIFDNCFFTSNYGWGVAGTYDYVTVVGASAVTFNTCQWNLTYASAVSGSGVSACLGGLYTNTTLLNCWMESADSLNLYVYGNFSGVRTIGTSFVAQTPTVGSMAFNIVVANNAVMTATGCWFGNESSASVSLITGGIFSWEFCQSVTAAAFVKAATGGATLVTQAMADSVGSTTTTTSTSLQKGILTLNGAAPVVDLIESDTANSQLRLAVDGGGVQYRDGPSQDFMSKILDGTGTGRLSMNSRGGFVTFGPVGTAQAQLHSYDSNALGSSANNSHMITNFQGNSGNTVGEETHFVRVSSGSDWTTLKVHQGINVDGAFNVPATRTWWERNPNAQTHAWGSGTSTFAVLGSTAFTLSDAINIATGTTTGTKIGTATTQKLGLWNVTPVVQPSTTGTTAGFTANNGAAVQDASTFTGGVGSTAYRISDIVLALKQIGALKT